MAFLDADGYLTANDFDEVRALLDLDATPRTLSNDRIGKVSRLVIRSLRRRFPNADNFSDPNHADYDAEDAQNFKDGLLFALAARSTRTYRQLLQQAVTDLRQVWSEQDWEDHREWLLGQAEEFFDDITDQDEVAEGSLTDRCFFKTVKTPNRGSIIGGR